MCSKVIISIIPFEIVCQCLIDYLQMVIVGFIRFSLASTITPFYVMEVLQLTYHLMEGIYAAGNGSSGLQHHCKLQTCRQRSQ